MKKKTRTGRACGWTEEVSPDFRYRTTGYLAPFSEKGGGGCVVASWTGTCDSGRYA